MSSRRHAPVLVLAAAVFVVAVAGTAGWTLLRDAGDPSAREVTTAPAPTTDGTATGTPAPPPEARPAPRIPDPEGLAEQLATERHLYVTGASEIPSSVEGSPARIEEDAARGAYADAEVDGGRPRIHAAELIASAPQEGSAQVRIETSTPAHRVVLGDGTVREVPESGIHAVVLDLRWDGSRWTVESTSPA